MFHHRCVGPYRPGPFHLHIQRRRSPVLGIPSHPPFSTSSVFRLLEHGGSSGETLLWASVPRLEPPECDLMFAFVVLLRIAEIATNARVRGDARAVLPNR